MYTCPMHPEIRKKKPGTCPKCGMKLVKEGNNSSEKKVGDKKSGLKKFKPLFIIVGMIFLGALAGSYDIIFQKVLWGQFMYNFMAGFFLVFSAFKLLDMKGFAEGYQQYDLIAKHLPAYGLIYPFIELTLGVLYAIRIDSVALHGFTLALMIISGIGVTIKIAKREKFQCACLGTFIDVPLTKVTIIEDFGMALMAAAMLIS